MNFNFFLCLCLILCKGITCEQLEKKISIIIPSYNNKQWYRKNLDSVCLQKYHNYSVIYIDDNSSDHTSEFVKQYINNYQLSDKIRLIKNTSHVSALPNIYNAIMMCNSSDIIVILDGDDWFAHERVLSLIAEAYQDQNVWATYSSYRDTGFYVDNEVMRNLMDHEPKPRTNTSWFNSFTPGHIRSFYAWLFKNIPTKDLFYQGKIAECTYDRVIYIPMMEMAQSHCKFINNVLCIHNVITCLNDHKANKKIQSSIAAEVLKRHPLHPLSLKNAKALLHPLSLKNNTASLVIIAYDSITMQDNILQSYNSIIANADGIQNSYIIKKNDEKITQGITLNGNDCITKLLHYLANDRSEYIILATADLLLTEKINVNEMIELLKQNAAYNLTLINFTNKKNDLDIRGTQLYPFGKLYQYAYTKNQIKPHNLNMTLYHKKTFSDIISQDLEKTIEEALQYFQEKPIDDETELGIAA